MTTPRYEFSISEIKKNYENICKKLPNCRLFYAVKANGNINVLEVIKKIGASFEVASVYEFDRVRGIGVDSSDMIFGLPIKTIETIKYTYRNGCRYYVFDDMRELHKLQKFAPKAKKILRIQISDIITSSIIYGMPIKEIEQNLEEIRKSIDGISFNISYNNNFESVKMVCARLERIMELLECKNKNYIVNIGGGYEMGVSDAFYEKYNELLSDIKEKYNCTLYAEPGKIIVGTAGAFYARVISVRSIGDTTILYMDGGLANGIGYATFLGDIENCSRPNKEGDDVKVYEFRDCTNLNETLIRIESTYDIEIDDEIKFNNLGAYSIVFQNEFHKWRKCNVDIID